MKAEVAEKEATKAVFAMVETKSVNPVGLVLEPKRKRVAYHLHIWITRVLNVMVYETVY